MNASALSVDATPLAALLLVLAPVVALLLGVLLGRRTGKAASRIRDLDSRLQDADREHDRLLGELEAKSTETDEYRRQVTDHFAGTSERLRDLALQYRNVYDHLAEGARDLCPEGFVELEGKLEMDRLDAGDALQEPLPGEGEIASPAPAETDADADEEIRTP